MYLAILSTSLVVRIKPNQFIALGVFPVISCSQHRRHNHYHIIKGVPPSSGANGGGGGKTVFMS